MDASHKLYLLPGLDGSGLLFQKILPFLNNEIKTEILPYTSSVSSYDKIFDLYKNKLKEENVYLLAESFGGPAAYRLSSLPSVKKIIFSASFIACPYRLSAHLNVINELFSSHYIPNFLLSAFLANSISPANQKYQKIKKMNLSIPPKTIKKRLSQVLNLPIPQNQIRQPVLYLRGQYDRLIGDFAHETIKGASPNFTLHTLKTSHLLLEECPREASKLIIKFIKS